MRYSSQINFLRRRASLKKNNYNIGMQKPMYILMSVLFACQTQAYRHTIFLDNPPLCNNLTCEGGIPHTACKEFKPHDRCSEFEMLDMAPRVINTMLLGHNGIRNKIATDWGIANMNILVIFGFLNLKDNDKIFYFKHWSRELERLSKYYLMECEPKDDVCDFLVEKEITIGHNYYFSKAPPSSRWPGRAIRTWYFELGYEIKQWTQFREALSRNISLHEITDIIWPTTEFVGCAAARMFDRYLATCYYHPAVTEEWTDFVMGQGCTKCPEGRPTCSRDFTNLCGLDVSYASAERLPRTRVTISILLMYIFHVYCF